MIVSYVVRTPLEPVFTAFSCMMYWAGLLKMEDRATFQAGVQRVIQVASSLADHSASRGRLMIEDAAGVQRG